MAPPPPPPSTRRSRSRRTPRRPPARLAGRAVRDASEIATRCTAAARDGASLRGLRRVWAGHRSGTLWPHAPSPPLRAPAAAPFARSTSSGASASTTSLPIRRPRAPRRHRLRTPGLHHLLRACRRRRLHVLLPLVVPRQRRRQPRRQRRRQRRLCCAGGRRRGSGEEDSNGSQPPSASAGGVCSCCGARRTRI